MTKNTMADTAYRSNKYTQTESWSFPVDEVAIATYMESAQDPKRHIYWECHQGSACYAELERVTNKVDGHIDTIDVAICLRWAASGERPLHTNVHMEHPLRLSPAAYMTPENQRRWGERDPMLLHYDSRHVILSFLHPLQSAKPTLHRLRIEFRDSASANEFRIGLETWITTAKIPKAWESAYRGHLAINIVDGVPVDTLNSGHRLRSNTRRHARR